MKIQASDYSIKPRQIIQSIKGNNNLSLVTNKNYQLPNHQQACIYFTSKHSKDAYTVDKLTAKIMELRDEPSVLTKKYKKQTISIIDFIKYEKPDTKETLRFLYSVSKDSELSKRMITELTQEPKKTRSKFIKLKEAVCDDRKSKQLSL